MSLIWSLLLGGRMGRYTGSHDTLIFDQRVEVRGFSAGSYAGLSLLHLLWEMPNVISHGKLGAIACPPKLLVNPPGFNTLHLFHYEADEVCVWKPRLSQLEQLKIHFTYVNTQDSAYNAHFGATDHNYSHWLALQLPTGWWDIARFLYLCPAAASCAKRDATPLRLISWLCFKLDPAVQTLLDETTEYLSTTKVVSETALLSLGTKHLGVNAPVESLVALRDYLIDLVSVGNLRHRPEALFALFRQFLQRLSLPRLYHFLDLVLPQLSPVIAPWVDATRTLWSCHYTSENAATRMDPLSGQRWQSPTSSRRMMEFIMCGCIGVYNPCCFSQIPESWLRLTSINSKKKRHIACISSACNWG